MTEDRPVITYVNPKPFKEGDELTPWGMIRKRWMTREELEEMFSSTTKEP